MSEEVSEGTDVQPTGARGSHAVPLQLGSSIGLIGASALDVLLTPCVRLYLLQHSLRHLLSLSTQQGGPASHQQSSTEDNEMTTTHLEGRCNCVVISFRAPGNPSIVSICREYAPRPRVG